MKEQLIIGMLLIGFGLVFFSTNKSLSRGTARLYQKIYTEKNLKVMFKVVGIILIIGGLLLIFFS
jgi:hypothetical protein